MIRLPFRLPKGVLKNHECQRKPGGLAAGAKTRSTTRICRGSRPFGYTQDILGRRDVFTSRTTTLSSHFVTAATNSDQEKNATGDCVCDEERAMTEFGWASHVTTEAPLDRGLAEAVLACKTRLPKRSKVDLVMVFLSSAYGEQYKAVVPRLRQLVPGARVVGCSGFGVIGMSPEHDCKTGDSEKDAPNLKPLEIEQRPALSLTLACLPGVDISTFHILPNNMPDLDSPPAVWEAVTGVPLPNADGAGPVPQFILMSDPTFTALGDLLSGLDFAYPSSTKIGGLCSSIKWDDARALFCDQQDDKGGSSYVHERGVVGLVLSGGVVIEPMVAQGCRPLGDTYTIASLQKHTMHHDIILELNDRNGTSLTPLKALAIELEERVSQKERESVQRNLMMGLAPDSFKKDLEACDFLCRPFVGVDPRAEALAVGEDLRVGQRVQFMVRDAAGAEQDLSSHCLSVKRRELGAGLEGNPIPLALGALMFSCNGRGEGLFGRPNVDSGMIHAYVNTPVSGFSCNGEIGPVEATTYLHGFTCVTGIIRPVSSDALT